MRRISTCAIFLCLWSMFSIPSGSVGWAVPYLDNETLHSNQDPEVESRRSDHFRLAFGHYNRDTGTPMSEQLAQGNLQMFEQMWNRWVAEMGMHDVNESVTKPDGNKYRANFVFLMTWNDGGGGGAYMSMDGNGFCWAMGNTGYCRYDPPSGATPHEFGHVWEGTAAGFNGTDSSGMWWECTANWMQLQFLNTYPQPGGLIWNSMYYPAHGRDYYDSYAIWEAALDDPRYGSHYVNAVWTDATPTQQRSEYIVERMVRVDSSGSPDKTNANRDLWGDMAKKCVTWDYERQQWFSQINSADDGSDWYFYQRARTPLVAVPAMTGWYQPERSHIPMEYGFNVIPLSVNPGTVVTCNFEPLCDPVRQSDWRACLVAVSDNNDARYSSLWNIGTNSIILSGDEHKLYLVVIATPKPMKIPDPMMNAYLSDAGLQFPYAVSFTNATPKNVVYPKPNVAGSAHVNGGGFVASTASVDASAYVGPNAKVLDSAQVRGNARIEDYAVVRNNAQVRDNAVVSGHAMVQDTAQIYNNAKVRDWGRVFGNAKVYENGKVIEHANCGDNNSTVRGNAVVKGTTYLYSPSTLLGSLILDGDTANGGSEVDHGVGFGWSWGFDTNYWNGLRENNYIYAQHKFDKDNPVFAMDEYGINHGFLINGARVGKDASRGGLVLPLDGISQYVELHNSINDWQDITIAAWVKWTGSANDQRIVSFGDGAAKVLYITPKDTSTGNLRLVISDGSTTQYINGTAPLSNTWRHVAVTLSGDVGTLYLNGAQVAQNVSLTLDADDLNAPLMENANYLGRGNAGNYFQGSIDDFRVYSKALTAGEVSAVYGEAAPGAVTIPSDTTAPSPNPPTWLVEPTAIGDSAVSMSVAPGTDESGWVEYYFTCTTGGGHDSGWVSFTRYADFGLTPGTAYTYSARMRDKNGNETAGSTALTAVTQISSAPTAEFDYGPVGISNSAVTMKAENLSSPSGLVEYLFTRNGGTNSGWQASPSWTDSGLVANADYTYTVQARDGRGSAGPVSPAEPAVAVDMAGPKLPIPKAHWDMQPYATIDNKVSMTAMTPSDGGTGVQYQFTCVSGTTNQSAWQSGRTYVSPVLPDGSYAYRYKARDSAGNESLLSEGYVATITSKTGYHNYSPAQLAGLPDDTLVSFDAMVTQVNAYSYVVKDPVTGVSYTVEVADSRNAKDSTTVPGNSGKSVNVKGHLYTRAGERLVTLATVTVLATLPSYSISGRVTNPEGTGISGATVYISNQPNASETAGFTATTNASGNYSRTMPDGVWYVAAGSNSHGTSPDQLVSVLGANVSNVNFTLVPNLRTMTGQVTRRSDGAPISGATVYFANTTNASGNPVHTAVTNASGNYTRSIQDGTWYVCSIATGFFPSLEQIVIVSGADVSGINFQLIVEDRTVPRTGNLIFGAVTDSLPSSGPAGNWTTLYPVGQNLTPESSPTMEIIDGVKWVRNNADEADGFDKGSYASPIPCNGASIITVVKPDRNGAGAPWTSCVDVFYDRLVLGLRNDNGRVNVRRNGDNIQSTEAVPDGQKTVLSLVMQADGQYKVWANGIVVMNITSTRAMTSLVPGVAGGYAYHINVGRNDPDGWTTFNGAIADTFLYDVALSDAEREELEKSLFAKFGIGTTGNYTVTATAGAGGSISPSGSVLVAPSADQAFTITPLTDYAVRDVTVDGASVGAVTAYTFNDVAANHSISAIFRPTAHTITASAGTGGSISPAGAVGVEDGGDAVFIIAPQPGYSIAGVSVDGGSVGAVGNYTFTNVTENHTISASFSRATRTITASAGPNGTISPSGPVQVDYTTEQVFTITPAGGYTINDVLVDDDSIGAVDSCSFVNVTADHTIHALFAAIPAPHTITATAGPNGSINPSGSVLVEHGANQSITITRDEGYAVDDVVVDGVSVGSLGDYNFVNVTADHTISATFKSILPVTTPTYTITAGAGANGNISPSGEVEVYEGSSQIFLITAQMGYVIQDVLVDGSSVGPVESYTFNDVTENHTIYATFELGNQEPAGYWRLR